MSSIGTKIKLAAETAKDVAKGILEDGTLLASDSLQEERLSKCKSCPHFIEKLKVCNECGCMMKLKTNLKASKCPIGKW